jgi:Uma2 family endonuclease
VATVTRSEIIPKGLLRAPALLANGDRMSQAEFHRRYEQYPDGIKFELIKGTVYMASPERLPHAKYTLLLAGVLSRYEAETIGVEAASDATILLADDSEPQPDLMLRITPGCGGQSWTDELYVAGPPELVIEIAHSTLALDLHDKKDDYQRNGILEYIVLCVEDEKIHWFDLLSGRSKKLPSDSILRSKIFPGLWIDSHSLFGRDAKQLLRVLDRGLATPQHARFVRRLQAAAKRSSAAEKSPTRKRSKLKNGN